MSETNKDECFLIAGTVMSNPKINIRTKYVYAMICSMCGESRECNTSLKELCKYSDMSSKEFYKHMQTLEKIGILEVQKCTNEELICVLHDGDLESE